MPASVTVPFQPVTVSVTVIPPNGFDPKNSPAGPLNDDADGVPRMTPHGMNAAAKTKTVATEAQTAQFVR
jgi:hypothetical protein